MNVLSKTEELTTINLIYKILPKLSVALLIILVITIWYTESKNNKIKLELTQTRCANGTYAKDGPHCLSFWEYLRR